ncbi:uncharacterized protein PGTG_12238 [Puccinia graminis f. sp. tritici CRL 75-36-700-3]|uniref:Uncharacterized protein n=1 Tax=Puccinia graminis f. sp. tritici (strain CRL 75-36-700-3 / race SCCL) TaxID=418459 RepID=E3KPP7_PUCGT|nr:uncharacterized protein PGTG_12238 [Puccinia graminis f. sp. tritici CRL 75-36-700-3]EFP86282.1 hypothetical protein PGTG_12238 [Puccinia graminis f. sp. tritici CRL 75-36-700-3]
MCSSINYKAIQGIILAGPIAELNPDVIRQHFPPHIIRLMVDQLQEQFCPSKTFKRKRAERVGQKVRHVLLVKDNGDVMEGLVLLNKQEYVDLIQATENAMEKLGVKKPGQEDMAAESDDDHGVLLTQGEHEAFMEKLSAVGYRLGELNQNQVVRVQTSLTYSSGRRERVTFGAYQGPAGLLIAHDQFSKFFINSWSGYSMAKSINETSTSLMDSNQLHNPKFCLGTAA